MEQIEQKYKFLYLFFLPSFLPWVEIMNKPAPPLPNLTLEIGKDLGVFNWTVFLQVLITKVCPATTPVPSQCNSNHFEALKP
jgi:hypothetical protein